MCAICILRGIVKLPEECESTFEKSGEHIVVFKKKTKYKHCNSSQVSSCNYLLASVSNLGSGWEIHSNFKEIEKSLTMYCGRGKT